MVGRGIDQILLYPSDPILHESYMKDARGYIQLAEIKNGIIPKPVSYDYVFGESIQILDKIKPHIRIINLETSITESSNWEHKGINYRMHPKNIQLLKTAKIDCCVLGNNHILDWGTEGLLETLKTLKKADIQYVGAGKNEEEAKQPCLIPYQHNSENGRFIIWSLACQSAGVQPNWAATQKRPGVYFVHNLEQDGLEIIEHIKARIAVLKEKNDVVIVSIHLGSNWNYEISKTEQDFARTLIDVGVDLIHGHSSHHFKGIEIYKQKLILYGCGDFITDYEGIEGYETFRGELSLMYFPEVDRKTGQVKSLKIYPLKMHQFKLTPVSSEEKKMDSQHAKQREPKIKKYIKFF